MSSADKPEKHDGFIIFSASTCPLNKMPLCLENKSFSLSHTIVQLRKFGIELENRSNLGSDPVLQPP